MLSSLSSFIMVGIRSDMGIKFLYLKVSSTWAMFLYFYLLVTARLPIDLPFYFYLFERRETSF